MAAPYVTGTLITTNVLAAGATPTAQQIIDAQNVADEIEAAIAVRLEGETPSAGAEDMLKIAALLDGSARFNSLSTPHGIASIGPDGDVVRLGAASLRALNPVIAMIHSRAGIGIG